MANDAQDKPFFKRSVFFELRRYMLDFLAKGGEPRIIVMPGLRGTGKTTLLAQLFCHWMEMSANFIFRPTKR
jgi:hypothetical protein